MFLITMFFNLLLLPFTLLRMALGLFGISTGILLLPLKIFAKNLKLFLILGAIAILYFALKSSPRALDPIKSEVAQATQQPATTTTTKQQKGAPPLVETVGKRENGDSAFATDLYATMTVQERAYYSAVFYKIMSTTADDQTSDWSNYNINGTMTPTRTFKNNSGAVCRSFTEVLKVHRIEQTITGTACDNGSGGWCKLRPNATPACGLGGSTPGMFDGISNAVRNLF